ncbi:hypothetical protein QBC41DRAFT_283884 [Cercophora samala]|uniref:Ecp2 effector protein domain-containing protein n=1 Tax=Cercophora samala TaxID=330535 RepID=A0AA39Z5D7_9PEZI|nr:hypothetical protein QBC41DRAFT_283884 [Cercophora samala]
MRLLSLLSLPILGTAFANAAALDPRNGNSTVKGSVYEPLNGTTLLNLATLNPPQINSGPHWPFPTEKIDCATTFAGNNKYAFLWALVRIQVEWIREDGPKYWHVPVGTPRHTSIRIGCCNEASYNLVVQETLTRPVAISGAEIVTMGLAAADHCKQGNRSRGRAWSRSREFTIEVYFDGNKCGKRCWQGD